MYNTLIFFLHLVKLLLRDTIVQVLEVSLPAVLARSQLKTFIRLASSIISLSPLFVTKHCIGETNLLKLERRVCSCSFASGGMLVGMVCKRKAAIRLLDLVRCRFMLYVQNVVQVNIFSIGKELGNGVCAVVHG